MLAAHQSIAFETVFSTDDKLDFVARARAAVYLVRVFFVGTSDPRINAARVAGRVMAGGHTVSIEKIISRYGRSMANLAGGIDIADRVYILPIPGCVYRKKRSAMVRTAGSRSVADTRAKITYGQTWPREEHRHRMVRVLG